MPSKAESKALANYWQQQLEAWQLRVSKIIDGFTPVFNHII